MGGATFVISYDTTLLSYPDNPENGTDFIFSNFNQGFYDTAKVTKVMDGILWLNIDLTSDGHGTAVQKGPDSWTDLVQLNFTAGQTVQNSGISWSTNDKFWGVYDSDNSTLWDKGNFDFVTSMENINSQKVSDYDLSQNYPNPFNPTTQIKFSVPRESQVTLKVYDILGNEIATLVNEKRPQGYYEVEFSAAGLSSGVYLYRLQAGSFIQTKKMILLK
jgi:hypothetical protein